MPKKICKKCGGTRKYEAWADMHIKMVDCPYCLGRKVIRASDFRRGEQVNIVAAVKSMAEMSRITGLSPYTLSLYTSETGNGYEIEAAMRKPGTVFWRLVNDYGPYHEKDWPN